MKIVMKKTGHISKTLIDQDIQRQIYKIQHVNTYAELKKSVAYT